MRSEKLALVLCSWSFLCDMGQLVPWQPICIGAPAFANMPCFVAEYFTGVVVQSLVPIMDYRGDVWFQMSFNATATSMGGEQFLVTADSGQV